MDSELLNLLYGGPEGDPITQGSDAQKEAFADGLITEEEVSALPESSMLDIAMKYTPIPDPEPMGNLSKVGLAALGVVGASLKSQYDLVEPVLTPVLDGLGFVQSAMTEGLAHLGGDENANMNRSIPMTGQQRGSSVQRVPSDLYGWGTIDQTGVKTGDTAAQMLGNGLIDTFSDPLDYIGIGLLGKLGNGITASPRFLKALSKMSLKDMPRVDKITDFVKDLTIPSRMTNKVIKSRADFKEGEDAVSEAKNTLNSFLRTKDDAAYKISQELTKIDRTAPYKSVPSVKSVVDVPTGMTLYSHNRKSLDAYTLDGDVISEGSSGLSPTQRSTTTTGTSPITDFSGGSPVVPEVVVTGKGDDYTYKLDPSGKGVDKTVIESPDTPSMTLNKEYVDVVNKNIYELEKTFPGFKVYGSARGVGEGGLPHVTDDFDGYITQEGYNDVVLGKYKRLSADHEGGTYKHSVFDGESGNIDFNIIQADENGFATGRRATELWRQSDPDSFFKAQAKSAKDGKPIQNPYRPQELIDNIDMTTKTIMDAMESGKPKHILRGDSYLTYGDADKVLEAQGMYVKSLVGGKGYTGPNFLDGNMLDSPKDNLDLLKKMKYKGDLQVIAKDPKRMQAAINDHYINSTVLSRTVKDEPENAFRQWLTEFEGGSVHGAGLNTVRLGTPSWMGDWHGNMQYGIKSNATTPDALIDELNYATGRNFDTKYSPEQKQELEGLLDKHGVDMSHRKLNTDNDLLNGLPTRKDPEEKVSKFLEEYSKVTGKRFLSIDSNFGNSKYVSALRFDDEIDAVGYYKGRDLDLKSRKLRNSLLDNTTLPSVLDIMDPKVFKGVKGYKEADPKLLAERFRSRADDPLPNKVKVDRITKFVDKKYDDMPLQYKLSDASSERHRLGRVHKTNVARNVSMSDARSAINIAAGVGVGGAGVYGAVEYAKDELSRIDEERETQFSSPESKEWRLNRKDFYSSDYYKSVADDILNGSGLSRSGRSKKHFDIWMAKKNKKKNKFSNGGKVNPFMKIGKY